MSKVLTDPNKAAHEIIEVLEDGGAIRNDGVVLTAANKNSWYVLATIYGEHGEDDNVLHYDKILAAKNRRAWNLWSCQDLNDAERADRAKKIGLDVTDLSPLGDAQKAKGEWDDINTRFQARMGKDIKLPPLDTDIKFGGTIFSNYTRFEKMVFERPAYFSNVVFAKETTFDFAVFSNGAVFVYATFANEAYFNHTTFMHCAYFDFTRFMIFTSFQSANFVGDANFSSAKFQSTTRFTDARFYTYVPQFHAAQLYDDTVFSVSDEDQRNWPPLQKLVKVGGEWVDVMSAADQKRAYNRLRQFMNKSLQIDEEQFFHRQEMRCKTKLARWYHKPLYWLFAAFSDYGNSIWRPVAWGALSVVTAALFMLWWQGVFAFTPQNDAGFDWAFGLLNDGDIWAKPRKAFGWSISNALPFIGTGNLYYGGDFAKELAWPLRVVGGVQTLFGFVLLFLFGLGLRNRFRLR